MSYLDFVGILLVVLVGWLMLLRGFHYTDEDDDEV